METSSNSTYTLVARPREGKLRAERQRDRLKCTLVARPREGKPQQVTKWLGFPVIPQLGFDRCRVSVYFPRLSHEGANRRHPN